MSTMINQVTILLHMDVQPDLLGNQFNQCKAAVIYLIPIFYAMDG